ncbi:MAG: hypothetical protein B6242_15410 [Anaerolineaceae bacterium 4572_78]|nr:MAG: hypothetical protein B6242_15410 [Anaerolineaceae bacterium 4572_78]
MNIQTIAATTLAMLVPYLTKMGEVVAQKGGENLIEGVGRLYANIKKKFSGDDYAEQTLKRIENNPKAKSRQLALEAVLIEKLERDKDFAKELSQLLQEENERSEGDIIKQQLSISGNAQDVLQIGKIGS